MLEGILEGYHGQECSTNNGWFRCCFKSLGQNVRRFDNYIRSLAGL